MSIWTSKVFFAGAMLILGSACTPIPERAADGAAPITSAKIGRGVTLNAPDGFCLDPDSLAQTFALLARCEVLSSGPGKGAPAAIITVSAPRLSGRKDLPEPGSLVSEEEALLNTYSAADLRVVQVAGAAPAEGLSGRYWRGAGRIGRDIIGLAIYPAAGGASLDEEGLQLIRETFDGLSTDAAGPPADTPDEKKPREGLFARLFN